MLPHEGHLVPATEGLETGWPGGVFATPAAPPEVTPRPTAGAGLGLLFSEETGVLLRVLATGGVVVVNLVPNGDDAVVVVVVAILAVLPKVLGPVVLEGAGAGDLVTAEVVVLDEGAVTVLAENRDAVADVVDTLAVVVALICFPKGEMTAPGDDEAFGKLLAAAAVLALLVVVGVVVVLVPKVVFGGLLEVLPPSRGLAGLEAVVAGNPGPVRAAAPTPPHREATAGALSAEAEPAAPPSLDPH